MFERRVYRRKSGVNAATVLLAIAALGLAFLILRPGPDNTRQGDHAAAVSAAAPANDAAADLGTGAAPDREDLSGLQHEVTKASQDLNALRAATAEMRAELSELRKQRDALAGKGQPGLAQSAASGITNPAPAASAVETAKSAQEPTSAAPVLAGAANGEANRAAAPAGAKPANATAEKQAAASEPPAKLAHHPHNAHGYLLTARDALHSGDVSAAEEALERAETWALNNSGAYRDNANPTDDPLVSTVQGVRAQLRAGHSASALRILQAILGPPRSAPSEAQAVR
jgi:hypothetical protein